MTKKQQRSLWSQLPQWAWKQGLRTNVDFAQHPDSSNAPADCQRQLPEHCTDIKTAQVITSRIEYPQNTDMHKPVLDIDFPAQLVPSTTPGHFHLYLDHEMTWAKYKALLNALADAGIIEDGYRRASIARGYTAVRPPWVRKEEQEPAPAPEEAAAAPAPQEAPQGITIPRGSRGGFPATLGPISQQFGPTPAHPWQPASHGPDYPNLAVRYDPANMAYTDGTHHVPIHAVRDRSRRGGMDVEALIERGGLATSSALWSHLVNEQNEAHYSIAVGARVRRNQPASPTADPLGDIIEARDRIAETWEAPQRPPSVAETGHPF